MIQFLIPILFLFTFSILIPIIIHLLSRKRGKTIKIGSVKLIAESQSSKLKNIKLSELPLLLLRTVLLILLVLLLAKPNWLDHESINEPEGKRWVLISPEVLGKTNLSINTKIDSLILNGYEPHLFQSRFPKINLNENIKYDWSTPNYWSLLREADAILPPGSKLIVFAPNRLNSIGGERPQLDLEVTWQPIAVDKSQWIEQVKVVEDNLQITFGFSDSSKTMFEDLELEIPKTARIFSKNNLPPVEVIPNLQKEEIHIRLVQTAQSSDFLTIQSNPPKLAIQIFYENNRTDDANYVRTAVSAVDEVLKIPISISMISIEDFDKKSGSVKVIFWLSSLEVPEKFKKLAENGTIIVTDVQSDEYEVGHGKIAMASFSQNEEPGLWRYQKTQNKSTAIWQDSNGLPVLQFESIGKGGMYRFQSRFHPSWNELVLKPGFPEWIKEVLLTAINHDNKSYSQFQDGDQRVISLNQLLPEKKMVVEEDRMAEKRTDLTLLIWLIAFFLFGFERWISERRTS